MGTGQAMYLLMMIVFLTTKHFMMDEALCHNEPEELYAQVTCLTGCKAYGEALNMLMKAEEKCSSSEVVILRQQLENFLRYEHREIFANTNLFMTPCME